MKLVSRKLISSNINLIIVVQLLLCKQNAHAMKKTIIFKQAVKMRGILGLLKKIKKNSAKLLEKGKKYQ